ncbi:MAG: alpha/beta hydrolase [Anaerolineales bacterium]
MQPRPSPAGFKLEGGPVGVLMIHGYTGSPAEMRLIAEYLNGRGLRISAPLLPGHGTAPADLNRVTWTDWADSVELALSELSEQSPTVFVAGLSMGALLSLYLAGKHPTLPGAIVYSPALIVANRLIKLVPLGKYLIPMFPKRRAHFTDPMARGRIWSYDRYPTFGADETGKLIREVKRLLPQVVSPLLIVHSWLDRNIRPESAQFVYDRVGSKDKELLMVNNSGHVLTVDSEWERVAEQTFQFIQAHLPRLP